MTDKEIQDIIEGSATADQSDSEIKTAYENNSDVVHLPMKNFANQVK